MSSSEKRDLGAPPEVYKTLAEALAARAAMDKQIQDAAKDDDG